jgi:hypothetical protein
MPDTNTILAAWPYAWAYFYPTILLVNAILTFTPAAHAICEQGGFPQPRNQPLNTYVYLFAGCQLMLGLAVAILEYTGEWRAVSVILASATPMGVIGTTLSSMHGFDKAFWTHVVMFTIGTSASVNLVRQYW